MNKLGFWMSMSMVFGFTLISAQSEIPIYEGAIPNSEEVEDQEYSVPNDLVDTLTNKVSVPTLKIFCRTMSNKNDQQ